MHASTLALTVDRLQGEGIFPVKGKHFGHGDLAPLWKDFHLLLFIVCSVVDQIDGEVLAVVDLQMKWNGKLIDHFVRPNAAKKPTKIFFSETNKKIKKNANLEIPDSEGGRQDGALESATAGYGFVGIKRRTRLVTENLFDNGFYPWNSE